MTPDDEILFGRVCDESHSSFERVERLRFGSEAAAPELILAVAEFELHGATLRSLRRWYPSDNQVGSALSKWEMLSRALASQDLPTEV